MILGGLQKTSLIDFPGKIAATIFLAGCNFRCPFCHNPELVEIKKKFFFPISFENFFAFLKKRKGLLEGVCITGGEPTIHGEKLLDFIRKIKKMGFLVKLDTNGSRPEVLRKLFEERLLDYVAMDIKNSPANYIKSCGVKVSLALIEESVWLIKKSGINYEFRTTVVEGLHSGDDLEKIGIWLNGSKKFVLQKFENQGKILNWKKIKQFQKKDQKIDWGKIKKRLENYFQKVEVR